MTQIFVFKNQDGSIKAAFTNESLAGWWGANFADPTDTSLTYDRGDPLIDKFEAGLLFYECAIEARTGAQVVARRSKEVEKDSNQGYIFQANKWLFYGYYWAESEQAALDRLEKYRYETLLQWAASSPLAPVEPVIE